MDNLRLTIDKVFKGAAKSFKRFPAAIISAVIIAIVAIIRIGMTWEAERSYSLLFDSIQISFLIGAVFSMAAITLDEIRSDEEKSFFVLANIAGILVGTISFLLLYFYGGRVVDNQFVYLSSIAIARAGVATFVSGVAFIYIMSKSKMLDSFSDSFFITHKALVVSGIYGLAIMLGVSGVLGAFQALVYNNMDFEVYQYLGVAVGFLTYTIFLGYFPSFREIDNEDEVEKIKEQPKFLLVLLDYILIPIMLALTVVLLIWSVRVILRGVDVSFNSLSAIATSYVIIGIWLHMMVAKHEAKIAEFYKNAYLFAGVLILAFQAWALFGQISKSGLRTAEYSFLMVWIFAVISVVMLIVLKHEAYRKIAITGIVISIIWVLPIIGYQDMTFNSQVNHLEKLLIKEDILVNDNLIPKDTEVDHLTRSEITSAVDFISYSDKENKPSWFTKDFNNHETFRDILGFERTYGSEDYESEYSSIDLRLTDQMVNISGYSLSLNLNSNDLDEFTRFEVGNASYEIKVSREESGAGKITVKQEGRIIIEEDMTGYLADLVSQYPEQDSQIQVPLEDMSLILEEGDLAILVVMNNANIYFDKRADQTSYYVDFHGIYIK